MEGSARDRRVRSHSLLAGHMRANREVLLIVGILAFALPGMTAFVLLILIAVRAIVTGVFEIVAAVQMRKYITGEWLLALMTAPTRCAGALNY